MDTREILNAVKNSILQVLPDTMVRRFGSRASDNAYEESDWDILVINKQPSSHDSQRQVRQHLASFSLQFSTSIHAIVVDENDWEKNPIFYSRDQSVLSNPVLS